jgi:hypothetical protein
MNFSMLSIKRIFGRLCGFLLSKRAAPTENVIILGTDYPEFMLSKTLTESGQSRVLFFIETDPWRHKTPFGDATCKYLAELPALCANHHVTTIYYVDDKWPDLVDESVQKLLKKAP